MTQSQVFEALGLAPESNSGNTPEVAEPANQELGDSRLTQRSGVSSNDITSGTGGRERETAAHEPEGAEPTPEGTGNQREEHGASSGTQRGGSRGERRKKAAGGYPADSRMELNEVSSDEEQRKENAAKRRREERQAAISRAVSDALDVERERHNMELARFFQAAGLKNPITGAPITNMDEFKVWKQAHDAAKLQKELKDGTLTPETLEQAISNSPSMQRMKQRLERDEQARRESAAAAAQVKIDAELQEIHRLDPTVRTTEDLLTMPSAKQFYEYVQKGNSFLDAFYLANRQRLTQATAEAAKQQTMNAARSKDHLQPSGTSRGAGAATVPAEELKLFKLLNPTASDSEIQNYYNKTKSK